MRVRVVRYYEKKCNLCFQWAQQSSQVHSDLFCCNKCFEKISSQRFTISNQKSQTYQLKLLKEPHEKDEKLNIISINTEKYMKDEPKNMFLNWSNIKSFISDNQILNDEAEQIYINDLEQKQNKFHSSNQDDEYQYNEDEDENNIKSFNDEFQIGKDNQIIYKSFIFNLEGKSNKFRSPTQLGRLSKICRSNIQQTSKINKYNFHFKKEEIERYKESIYFLNSNRKQNKCKVQRQFGTQLQPLQLSNIKFKSHNLNLVNSNFRKIKFTKFNLSKSCISQNERLTDQQLKNIIFPYLQQKLQSKTVSRLMATYVKQAYLRTNLNNKMLELISFKITSIDIQCYLNLFDFNSLNVIKLVKVDLSDQQFYVLMQHLQNYKVQILVLTGNNLSQNILSYLQNKSFPHLRGIYIGKNRINNYKSKENISQLRNKYAIHI